MEARRPFVSAHSAAEIPMTEELFGGWMDPLGRTCRGLSKSVDRELMRQQLSAHEFKGRVTRDEARRDLLEAAYSVAHMDHEDHGVKCSRYN